MRIAIGSDHAGFEYKTRIELFLIEAGHVVEDFGCHSTDPVDYPLFIRPVAEAVAAGEFDRGIVLGGSGNGEAIVANRVPGIRCALCWNLVTARLAREHNDANVISLGARMVSFEEALAIVETWLESEFEGGRHLQRIRQIDAPPPSPRPRPHEPALPHRADMVDESRYVCDCCREEFTFPVDMTEGSRQQLVHECPVCCHENVISLEFDAEGELTVHGDRSVTG